jgi:hypothetical protein
MDATTARGGGARAATCALVLACLASASSARADEPAAATQGEGDATLPADAQINLVPTKPEGEASPPEAPPEAPPPRPYKKTLVLDSSLGAVAFLGEFGKVAPPGPWLHTQLGYELFRWLMVFGEGELAFTDTSRRQDPPKTRVFPFFGFGGGARFTARFTERFGVYLQGSVGLMRADVNRNALGILGFRDAETFAPYAGGRLGVEWYQIDRHFALGLNAGVRLAQGFARAQGASDTPLVLDGGASLRYAF